jgi:hypothetical protein
MRSHTKNKKTQSNNVAHSFLKYVLKYSIDGGGEEADLRVWQQRFISGNIPVNLFFINYFLNFHPPPPPPPGKLGNFLSDCSDFQSM